MLQRISRRVNETFEFDSFGKRESAGSHARRTKSNSANSLNERLSRRDISGTVLACFGNTLARRDQFRPFGNALANPVQKKKREKRNHEARSDRAGSISDARERNNREWREILTADVGVASRHPGENCVPLCFFAETAPQYFREDCTPYPWPSFRS